MAFAHLEQAWVKNSFENTISPLRIIVHKNYSGTLDSLEPLFIHFIENDLHLQWSKQNLLSLSRWLLHLSGNQEFNEVLKNYRDDLQNIADCSFLKSFEMRILESSKGRIFNKLPSIFKNMLINHLIIKLSSNRT